MKLALSWVCYYIGDILSRTLLQLGIGYRVYTLFMTWSCDLDTGEKIWKKVPQK